MHRNGLNAREDLSGSLALIWTKKSGVRVINLVDGTRRAINHVLGSAPEWLVGVSNRKVEVPTCKF
jgi:hypothetical protein